MNHRNDVFSSLVMLCFCAGGCGDQERPRLEVQSSATVSATPTPSAGPPARDPSPAPVLGAEDVEAARAAYAELVTAFNDGAADLYFGHLADTLSCFYGEADVPRGRVRRQRWRSERNGSLATASLRLIARDARGEAPTVAFVDRGFFSEGPDAERQALHEKIVVLGRLAGSWTLIAETNRAGRDCLPDTVRRSLDADPHFESCRDAHRACMRSCSGEDPLACRRRCETAARQCLGLSPDPRVEAGIESQAGVRSDDELARFLRMALEEAIWGYGENPETALFHEHGAWYRGAQRALDIPLSPCTWVVVPSEILYGFRGEPSLTSVECDAARRHCVAWFEDQLHAAGEDRVPLHLLFDERGRLELTRPGPPTAARPARLPPPPPGSAPSEECDGLLRALLNDRAGTDFFSAFADLDGSYTVTRHCGRRAERALREIGDEWLCDRLRCVPLHMCGNGCSGVVGARTDDGVVVTGHYQGDSTASLSRALLERFRERVACGATETISYEEAEGAAVE